MDTQGNSARPRPELELTEDDYRLLQRIEQFLYREAALLDERRFREWLDLFTDDVEYWMPVRSTRQWQDEASEFTQPGEAAFFDEDKAFLEERVRKLYTGVSWSEDPPSRARHFVSNVRLLEKLGERELLVTCNFLVYRSRLAMDEDFWIGRREDTLRLTDDGWRIARRHIFIDQVSLTSKNLSVFF